MKKTIRRLVLALAGLVCLAAWGGVAWAYFTEIGVAGFTLAVTIAAIATEAFIWALALVAGWSIFANRKALWAKLTGRGGRTVAGVVVATGLAVAATPYAADAQAARLYHGATLIDPAGERIVENAWVLVENGRIARLGAGAPPAASAVYRDMSGLYVLPGFFDAHGHITAGPHAVEIGEAGPMVTMESVDEVTRFHARIALAFGVTTLRNPGSDPQASAEYDARIASGEWIGPDALHAGAVMQPAPFGGNAFRHPQDEAEWMAEAAREAALGMTYFKLYHGLTEEELALGAAAARAHGLIPIAHLDHVSWTRAVELGVQGLLHALPTSPDLLEPDARAAYLAGMTPDSRFYYRWFEHVDYDGPLMQEMFALLSREQVSVDMTLLVNALTYSSDAIGEFFPEEERRYYHPASFEASQGFLALGAAAWTPEDHARAAAVLPKVLELPRRLHAAGVPVLIGTDSAGGGPLYAEELALHVQAGFTPWQVLRLATSEAAAIMGLDDRTGRLAEGLEADLVFLRADPLTDILAVREVEIVLSNGREFSHADLARPLGE